MVIKVDCFGQAMNRKLTDYGLEVPDDRREWRYYKHLAGMYHHLDEDIMITSLDDSTEIVFNRENLKRHKKTRSVYLYNRKYPDALKEMYPEQTVLINGILRPVDIDTAIESPDGTVLTYNQDLIEKQEYRLIPEIEQFVRGFLHRLQMESLLESEDMYAVDMASKLYAFLPVRLLDIRNKYVRSSQTHTFHIMAFLASNQRLDEFAPYLTYDQMLFLYRNILYIEQHTGMQHTFNMLVEHLLTSRNLPIYDYTLRQRDMDLEAGELQPYPIFVKNQLNLRTGLSSRDLNEWEIDDILFKEVPLASDNQGSYEEYLVETEKLTSRSSISNIPTKLLEVSAIDPEDVDPIKLIDVLINEWMHQAATGMYSTQMEIINPLNGDTIRLDPKGMFLLYIYSHAAGFHGIEMKEIPTFIAKQVLRKRWIDESEYLKILEHDHFNGWDDEIEFFTNTHPVQFVEALTPEEFLEQALELLKRQRVRHQYAFQAHRSTNRTGRRAMYHYNYIDAFCDFKEEFIQDFNDFFMYIALDKEKMSADAWKDLAMQALDKATMFGSMNRISLKEIQAAMVRLFRRLSSYTVQFIEEIVGGEATVADPLCAILGDTFEEGEGDGHTRDMTTTVENVDIFSFGSADATRPVSTIVKAELIEDRSFDIYLHVKATADEMAEVHFNATRPSTSVRAYTVEELQ